LLSRGADPASYEGRAISTAVGYGRVKVVKLMIDSWKGNINQLLLIAVVQNKINMMTYLASKGANLHSKKILRRAVYNGHLEAIAFLIKKGVNPHADAKLPFAAYRSGSESVIELLKSYGVIF